MEGDASLLLQGRTARADGGGPRDVRVRVMRHGENEKSECVYPDPLDGTALAREREREHGMTYHHPFFSVLARENATSLLLFLLSPLAVLFFLITPSQENL